VTQCLFIRILKQASKTKLRRLDEFYRYIDRQEQSLRVAGSSVANAATEAPHSLIVEAMPAAADSNDASASAGTAKATETKIDPLHRLDPPDYLPPLIEAAEPPEVVAAGRRPVRRRVRVAAFRQKRGGRVPSDPGVGTSAAALSTAEPATDLWRRLPRHVQILAAGMEDAVDDQIGPLSPHSPQSCGSSEAPRETRAQLIERLLDPAVSTEDTARLLGVCSATVRRYAARGVLPCYHGSGQRQRINTRTPVPSQRRAGPLGAAATFARRRQQC
jgi:hypothetical protein